MYAPGPGLPPRRAARLDGVSDALEPVYLICGTDRPKVLRAVARLARQRRGRGRQRGAARRARHRSARRRGPCEQLGLFGGDRLVLVSGVETWTADAVKLLEPYLGAPTPGTTLALVAGPGMRKDHRLLKVVDGKRRLAFDLPGERELPAHLRKEAQRLGAQLDSEALRLLIDIVGPDAIALEGELDKLATYAAGEPIDAEMVEALAFPATASPSSRSPTRSRARQRSRRSGCSSARSTRGEAARAAADGRPADGPAAAGAPRARRRRLGRARSRGAGVHEFRAKKAMAAAAAWSEREAALAVCRLADADHAMKGGRRIDPELALERALAESL